MKSNDTYHFRAAVSAVVGLSVGALAMYLLDPDNGRHRRALLKKTAEDAGNKAANTVTGTAERIADGASQLGKQAGQAVEQAKRTMTQAPH